MEADGGGDGDKMGGAVGARGVVDVLEAIDNQRGDYQGRKAFFDKL